jgi:hypothetical protein
MCSKRIGTVREVTLVVYPRAEKDRRNEQHFFVSRKEPLPAPGMERVKKDSRFATQCILKSITL